jgi:hypothetical protein
MVKNLKRILKKRNPASGVTPRRLNTKNDNERRPQFHLNCSLCL